VEDDGWWDSNDPTCSPISKRLGRFHSPTRISLSQTDHIRRFGFANDIRLYRSPYQNNPGTWKPKAFSIRKVQLLIWYVLNVKYIFFCWKNWIPNLLHFDNNIPLLIDDGRDLRNIQFPTILHWFCGYSESQFALLASALPFASSTNSKMFTFRVLLVYLSIYEIEIAFPSA